MGDTLKVTDGYLSNTINPEILKLYNRFTGQDDTDTVGKALFQHLTDFAAGTKPGKLSTPGSYSLLLAGNTPEGVAMQGDFKAFVAKIIANFTTLGTSMQNLSVAVLNAEKTLNNADDDALSTAQMLEILGGGSTTPPPPPPP